MKVKDIKFENIFEVQYSEGKPCLNVAQTAVQVLLHCLTLLSHLILIEPYISMVTRKPTQCSLSSLFLLFLLPTKLHLPCKVPPVPEILIIQPLRS
jgi:hypothetical protein